MNNVLGIFPVTAYQRQRVTTLLLLVSLLGLVAADLNTVSLDLGLLPTNYKASSVLTSPVLNSSSDSSGNADSNVRLGAIGLIRKPLSKSLYVCFGAGAGVNVFTDKSHSPSQTKSESNATTGYLDGYVGPSFVFMHKEVILDVLMFAGGQWGKSDMKADYTNGSHIAGTGTVVGPECLATIRLAGFQARKTKLLLMYFPSGKCISRSNQA